MRILHVNKFLYRRGGAEGYMLDLAELQRGDGHEVLVWGMDHPENDAPGMLAPRPSFVEFEPAPSGKRERAQLLARMVWSREARQCMERALAQWKPDLIHCHNIYHQLSPSVLAPAAERGIPIVLTMHDYKLACPTYEFLDQGKLCVACVRGGPWQAAIRACKDGNRAASTAAAAEVWWHRRAGAYDPVQRFIAPSRFLADKMREAGVYPDRLVVQNNFTVIPPPPRTRPSRGGVVFAGRLSPEKGVGQLISAVGAVNPRIPETCDGSLTIVGDGPQRDELERRATMEAPGLVEFTGRLTRPQVLDQLRQAAVAVVPSQWHENQPLAVLEAFATETPVIASGLGGLPELIAEGHTGWIFNDAEQLEASLREALSDVKECGRRGLNALAEATNRFGPSEHLAAVKQIYHEAVQASQGGS